MATYLYQCDDCGKIQEVHHGMFEEPTIECPQCGSTEANKVPTCPGILFDWHDWGDKGVVVGKDRFRGPTVPQYAS